MTVDYTNQLGIFDPAAFGYPVHLVGMGGIGSTLFFPLLKLGVPEVHIWDTDIVVAHNIPSQLIYRPSDIGLKKVVAAKQFAERQEADCEVVAHDERVDENTELEGVVISGVDSMASRKAIWEAIQRNVALVPLYMDGRIGGEALQLLTVLPSWPDAYKYEAWLFSEDRVAPLPCTERAVIHPAIVLAGNIVSHLTLTFRQLPLRKNVRLELKTYELQLSPPITGEEQ